jgi:sec-independent protein translocase protein TatC
MSEESPLQSVGMGLWDHLMELRVRLLRALIGVAVGCILAAIFTRYIVDFLCVPIEAFRDAHPEAPEVFRDPDLMAGFSTWLSVSLFGGLMLAMPYVLYQVWSFVRPALKTRERGAVVPLVLGGTALFFAGVAVAYYFVAPAALDFLFSMNRMFGIEQTSGLPKYIKLMITLMLGFGLGFQLPLVMLVLSWTSLVGADFFRQRRKYALVLAFVFGAFLTPPDVPSQMIMAVCLLLLYELGILLSAITDRKRARRAAEEDAADAEEEGDAADDQD